MLLGQNRSRRQEDDLLSPHQGLEGSAQSHLGLSETDIPAEETIHRSPGFHVLLDLGNGTELIRSFLVWEAHLQLPLPRRVGPIGVPLSCLSLGLEFQETPCIEKNRFFRGLPRFRPLVVTERREMRRLLSHTDIARDLPGLVDRNKESGIIRKFQC